ncbi:LOW QUALITY PROTEIN: ylmG homolog protein 1-2, chloroplastic [Quercus suber]|uniref:LOW QUALITY PROTEIN: ylmG homolog protein 1-2, chloroplastic n=1 Tax=Quercus suber TaxID=58331 RepID=UPI0032DEB799
MASLPTSSQALLLLTPPSSNPKPFSLKPLSLSLRKPTSTFVCSSSTLPSPQTPSHPNTTLTTATTLSTIASIAISFSTRLLLPKLPLPLSLSTAATTTLFFASLKDRPPGYLNTPLTVVAASTAATTTLFFASLKDRPPGYLNTPLTVVAAGLAKWLDIYSGVLMVRVLLSWFPNIPWDRQPLSAIRDLCDPYLNLFRNIIPPIFDTLDVSPLLAFAVLGTLGSILNSARGGMY